MLRHSLIALLVVGAALATAVAAPPPQVQLLASDGAAYDYCGASVAIDGETALVGGHQNDGTPNAIEGPGVAYVHVRGPVGWFEQAKLVASPPTGAVWFGFSVDVSGDLAIVGAPAIGPGTAGTGAAYIFHRANGIWSQEAMLTAADLQLGDGFGRSVAIDGSTAVVGAPDGNGGAYVFVRTGTTWGLQQKLAPNTGLDFAAQFGSGVDVDGDRIAVGASGLDYQSYDSGATYIFDRVGATWTQNAFLIASDGTVVTYVGLDVALDGDTLVVGSQNDAAYVYRNNGGWSEVAKLQASGNPLYFGLSVAIADNQILVGAPNWNSGSGAAYRFLGGGALWVEEEALTASGAGSYFGTSVAIDGDRAIVGSSNDVPFGAQSGSAYAYHVGPVGQFTDLGNGLAGVVGVPSLAGSGTLLGGDPASFDLTQASPSSAAWLVYGVQPLFSPFFGGILVPNPSFPGGVIPLATNGAGELHLSFSWPPGITPELEIFTQCWIADPTTMGGLAASNGLKVTTP